MKTIEEKSDEYVAPIVEEHAECRWCDAGELEEMLKKAFEAGAQAVQGWNEVILDKKGFVTQECRDDIKNHLPVVMRLSRADIFFPIRYSCWHVEDWVNWAGRLNMGYTQSHWRPI